MKTNLCIKAVCLIMTFALSFDCNCKNDNQDIGDTIVLNKIDISSGSKILDILSDVTSECEPSNSGRVYSIYIKD